MTPIPVLDKEDPTLKTVLQALSARHESGRPTRPRPPRVCWESRQDRARTPDHRAIRKEFEAIVHDVWRRMPLSACLVLSLWEYWDGTITLENQEDAAPGIFMNLSITLNVSGYRPGKRDRELMAGTCAHELAHAYLMALGCMAAEGLNRKAEEQPEPPKEDGNPWRTAGLPMDGWGAYHGIDKGQTQYAGNSNDRLADAVMIAWGFGREFALQMAYSRESYAAQAKRSWKYLTPEILAIYKILRRGEARKGRN